jgi:hypothetical protein
MMHKVNCLVCGKKGRIKVFRGKKVRNENWCYFGKIMMNYTKHDKYFYELLSDKKGNKKNGDSGFKTKKINNPDYVPGTRPVYIEYWECRKCCGH